MHFLQFDGSLSKQERERVLNEFESKKDGEWMQFEEEANDSEVLFWIEM